MSDVESAKYWLSWIEFGGTIALFLVAVGVGYEFIANRLERPFRATVEHAREAELVRMRKDTADANARAEQASKAAAEANERAAQATARAAELQLELEKLKAPRIIQRDKEVVGKLRAAIADLIPYGGLRVEIFHADNENEVVRLRDQIVGVLVEAGWDARSNLNRRIIPLPLNGVTIEIPRVGTLLRQTTDRRGNRITYNLAEKATALVAALQHGGLEVHGPFHTDSLLTDAPIEIIVGNKPVD